MYSKGRTSGAPQLNAISATTTTPSPPPQPPQMSSEPSQHPSGRRRAGGAGAKRKANSSNTSGGGSAAKRTRGGGGGDKSFTAFLPSHRQNHNGPITRARQSPNKAAAAAAAAAAASGSASVKQSNDFNLTSFGANKSGVRASHEAVLAKEEPQVPFESIIDAEFSAIRSRDQNAHVIPTHAAWFSWTKVHPLEEKAMASFFNGKSEKRTSEIYMEIRNSIMRIFHKDPKTLIEAKDMLEMSTGELEWRQEVFEFLDHWGLINYHPFPEEGSNTTAETDTEGSSKMTSLIEKLYQFEAVESHLSQVGHKAELSTQAMLSRLLPESAIPEDVRPEGPNVEYHCNSCSTDCSRKRYHCQKQADFDLCFECYSNGKFDSGMFPTDFILMEPAEVPGVSGGSWTDQETLLLLEALEIFGEKNWNEIAEHVATKSKAQCILHFIQMPIEDTFREDMDDFDPSLQKSTDLGPTNDDSPSAEESHENKERKTATDDTSSFKESHEKSESKVASNDDSSTVNAHPEIAESKGSTNEEQSLSPKVDLSEQKEESNANVAQQIVTNYAVDALKEAFQAVGSLFEPGESLSFADAGNPVMALAAYLGTLVEPEMAAAWARSSLKSSSEDSPGIQFAARHCFILEDPPEELKEFSAPESVDVEMADAEAHKDDEALKIEKKEEGHKTENQAVLDGSNVAKEFGNKKIEDQVPKESTPLVCPQDEGKENLHNLNESEGLNLKEDDPPSTVKEDPTKMEGDPSSTVKEDLTKMEDDPPSTVKEDPTKMEGDPSSTVKEDLTKMEDDSPSTVKEDLTKMEDDPPSTGKEDLIEKGDEPARTVKDDPPSTAKKDLTNKEDDLPNIVKEDLANKGDDPPGTVKEDLTHKDDDPPCTVKEDLPRKNKDSPSTVSDDVPKKDDDPPSTAKEDLTNKEDNPPNTAKESNDSAVPEDCQPSTVNGSGELAVLSKVLPSSEETSDDVASQTDISKCSEVSKDVDMVSNSIPLDEKDPERFVAPTSAVEVEAKPVKDVLEIVDHKSEKTINLPQTIDGNHVDPVKRADDNPVDRVKRAALTALSAAALKAKLLADQEEDQIRQLATFLIEKQLHKLESKFAFFFEMESIMMRVREQIERSKQRLYHERAQIIAARLGLPASSSRAVPSTLPINRVAMSYANSVPKSLLRGPAHSFR